MSDCHCNCEEGCSHEECKDEKDRGCKCSKKAFLIHLAIISVAAASAILLVKAIRR